MIDKTLRGLGDLRENKSQVKRLKFCLWNVGCRIPDTGFWVNERGLGPNPKSQSA